MNILIEPQLSKVKLENDLLSYRKWLKDISEASSVEVIRNSGIEKASLLMAQIFNSANQYVYIYSGGLSEKLTGTEPYYSALEDCLRRNVEIKVLLQDERLQSPAMELIKSNNADNVKLLNVKEIYSISRELKMDAHFAISDDKVFRIEYDVKEYKAFASFNNPKVVDVLKSIFNTYMS